VLQNIQLVVGKHYESEEERKRVNRPLFSIVMDEFAPFGYQNFSQILNTARGTHTAFLFSMQIRELFEVENRIDRFLYLAANPHIHSLLKKCFWGTTRSVYIGLANDLSHHKLEAVEVVNARTMQRRRFADSFDLLLPLRCPAIDLRGAVEATDAEGFLIY
jgi:hypothetical protein